MALFIIFFVLPLPLLIWFFIRSKNRKTKWYLGISMVLFIVFYVYMLIGLWGLEIEDKYQGHENVYFDGSKGDTVVLTDSKTNQFIAKGQIQRKTWNKIFIKTETDTLEFFDWMQHKGNKITEVNCELK